MKGKIDAGRHSKRNPFIKKSLEEGVNMLLEDLDKFYKEMRENIEVFGEVLAKKDSRNEMKLSEAWIEFIGEYPEYKDKDCLGTRSSMGFESWAWHKNYKIVVDYDECEKIDEETKKRLEELREKRKENYLYGY